MNVANVNNSSISTIVNEETKKRVSNKVKSNADGVKDTSLSIDEEEYETPKKKEIFSKVKELFGFCEFDREAFLLEMAKDLANGVITPKEFFEKQKETQKGINSSNAANENISFEDICKKIESSNLLNDFSLFVGTKDLLSLKNLLISSDGSVVLYHGKQSEDGESFNVCKVTVKGLHKPFIDFCYSSKADFCTSNLLRAFRNYCYYLASVKRCRKQREKENSLVSRYLEIKAELHKTYGYMSEDFEKL